MPVLWVQHEDDGLVRQPGVAIVPELVPAAASCASTSATTPPSRRRRWSRSSRGSAPRTSCCRRDDDWCIRAAGYAALDRGYDLTLVKDAHTTDSMTRADGSVIEARGIVDDLNLAMTWLDYPGRRSQAAAVDELAFG